MDASIGPRVDPIVVAATSTRTAPVPAFDVVEQDSATPVGAAERAHTEQESPLPVDEFRAAARAFSFPAERPTQSASASEPEPGRPASGESFLGSAKGVGARARRSREVRPALRRITAASFSAGVISLVGLMTVGLTTPAEALPHEHTAPDTVTVAGDVVDPGREEIQAYVAPSQVQSVDITRTESYSVASLVDLAGTVGISNFSDSVFSNDQTCSIQWPYAVGVPMTYGFGMREGGMHQGIDLIPGAGAQIQAIADGVVRIATDVGGAYGVTIVIDHVVNGQQVSSRYAHMEFDSRQVEVGDTVSVGQYIGRTGNSGRSFGAHLHLEILDNGSTAIDPLPWLRSYATC